MSIFREDYSTLERKLKNKYTELTRDKNIILNNDFQMDVYDWGASEYFVKTAKEIKNGIIQTDENQDEEQTEFNELCMLSRISLIEELEN